MPHFAVLAVLAVLTLLSGPTTSAVAASTYSYTFKGELVTMTPSARYVAAKKSIMGFAPDFSGIGLSPAADLPQGGLNAKGYVIYSRSKGKGKGEKAATTFSPQTLVNAGAGEVQPVFEQGWAIMVPTDRVIVGFSEFLDLGAAKAFLAGTGLGVRDVLPHRKNAVIAVIDNPGDGRAFQVARALAELPGVAFAEPDNMVIFDRDLKTPKPAVADSPAFTGAIQAASAGNGPAQPSDRTAAPGWTVISSINAESATLPAGWVLGYGSGAVSTAFWGRTSHRAHSGASSYYCGQTGVAAPGPTQASMTSIMEFQGDLSAYEEVYVEFWFYAKNEVDADDASLYDYGVVVAYRSSNTSVIDGKYLVHNGPYGDMTVDPTTVNGWRRCLFRIPPAIRTNDAVIRINFFTDTSVQTEGLYIDDVRIVGSTNVDTEPLGSDTFAGRQYELRNVGQVAGLGGASNDMNIPEAWAEVPGPYTPVVAIIDDGVELTHPDLNLGAGYNFDGTSGGGPKNDTDSHGTACAGNTGAVANSIGVRGTAPGVTIMPVEALGSAVTYSDMASGIDVAVAHGAKVLSNSWGWVGSPVTDIVNAISDALVAGRVVVFAAGNGPDRSPWTYDVAFPGNQTATLNIITVGASSMTDEHKAAASSDGQFGWGSSYVGAGPNVVAPGPWSYATDRQGALGYNNGWELSDANYTASFGGTSSATPKVAGVCALILAANPSLTPAQVKSILCATADDIGDPGNDDKTGCGRVNALAAVRMARNYGGPTSSVDCLLPLLLRQ